MEFFGQHKIYGFMKISKLMAAISIVFAIISIVLLLTRGLNYGIDFAGGTVAQVKYTSAAPIDEIRKLTSEDPFFHGATVTKVDSDNEVSIKFAGSTEDIGHDVGDRVSNLLKGTGDFEIRQVNMVGPKVGDELRKKGLMSIVVSLAAILIYIAVRFEWRFGLAAVISEFHDVFLIIGVISFLQIDVNLEILAAVLTLLAYSLNDTIVVFDRIRDEFKQTKLTDLSKIIDISVSKTLSRTILTSLATLLVVLALLFFGGASISGFALTLTIGIIIGTYSSVFIAAPLLKWLRFDIGAYKAKMARKEKARLDKEKMRAQYERGVL
ncbi:MAG: protein translocase subunit SecF [Campylobacteraceae bacterium]